MEQEKNLLDLLNPEKHPISRRAFLKSCGLSVLLAGLPLNLSEAFADEDEALDHVMLTWMQDPETTQTVAWRARSSIASGSIQWVETAAFKKTAWDHVLTTAASPEQLNTDLGTMDIHYVTLNNLKPGTQYTYRVGDGNAWSGPYHFTTEQREEKPFKFLVFGDSQSGLPNDPEYGPWRTTIHNAYKAQPDASFLMVVGDLVEVGQKYDHWNNWYAAAKDVIEKIPNMAVLGNHETYDVPEENHSSRPFYFTGQVKIPLNGPEALKGQVYSFDYGNVHFAVLDSQEAEEGQYIPDMLKLEAEWLDQDLSSSNKKWKLVFFHKTPYYNKAVRANEKLKAALLPVIDKHHVDLVINGHDHGYSRTYPIYQDSFVASPAKGTVYVVAGRSGNKFYTDLSQKVWDAFFHDPQAEPNYIVFEVAGNKLTLKAYTQSGSLIDTYTIDKSTGTDMPPTSLPERSNDTRLVIWGNMLQTPLINMPPLNLFGTWYVPLQSFFEFVGGTVEMPDSDKFIVKYNKNNYVFWKNDTKCVVNEQPGSLQHPLQDAKGTSMIAAEDVKTLLGFGYKYDAAINMLLMAK